MPVGQHRLVVQRDLTVRKVRHFRLVRGLPARQGYQESHENRPYQQARGDPPIQGILWDQRGQALRLFQVLLY